MKGKDKRPIFVVGFPRSGTTLLAAMLAGHSQLSCGPETRFFQFLAKSDPEDVLFNWPDNALDFLYSVPLMDIPVPDQFDLSRAKIRSYLSRHNPSISVMLSSLCEQFMIDEGKSRWVEKSPEHLRHVHTIRKYFPEAPIIRIIRDPRDAALSMIRMPWGTNDYLGAILLWRQYDDLSSSFFYNDLNSYSLYYEELVKSPESSLRKICDFLDERFEPGMLDTSKSAPSVITSLEPWKQTTLNPVDKSRINVWKRELSEDDNRQTEAVIGDRLRNYRFETVEHFDNVANVYPSIYKLFEYRDFLDRFLERGFRFWSTDQDGKKKALIFIGEPDRDKWLSASKPRRWFNALRIVGEVILGKLRRQEIYWVKNELRPAGTGITSKFISLAFKYTLES